MNGGNWSAWLRAPKSIRTCIARQQNGFTIVEIMVFLAVSGVLFLIAMVAINGKQNQANFAAGVLDFNDKIQTVINDVGNGFFPTANFACDYASGPNTLGGAALIFTGPVTSTQGTHPDCIFLGKILYFDFYDKSHSNTPINSAALISVAADASDSNGLPSSDYSTSNPTLLNGSQSQEPNYTEKVNVNSGIVVTDVMVNEGGSTPQHPSSFAILTSLPQSDSGSAGLLATNTMALNDSNQNEQLSQLASHIQPNNNGITSGAPLNPSIVICLEQAVSGKRAAVIIGSSNRQVSTELHIDDVDSSVPKVMLGATCPT